MEDTGLDFRLVCQWVGQLFLESRGQVEQLSRQLETTRRERDEALTLLRDMGSHAAASTGNADSENQLRRDTLPSQ